MNIIKRLTRLSVDDLQDLQTAIMDEIERRKEIAGKAQLPPLTIVMQRRKELSGTAKLPAAASRPAPTTARPASPRRAA